MRLIDADELLNAPVKLLDKGVEYIPLFHIERMPTIDAVPVIRCKDCKYYKENTLACSRYGLEDDDYCSWAERRE